MLQHEQGSEGSLTQFFFFCRKSGRKTKSYSIVSKKGNLVQCRHPHCHGGCLENQGCPGFSYGCPPLQHSNGCGCFHRRKFCTPKITPKISNLFGFIATIHSYLKAFDTNPKRGLVRKVPKHENKVSVETITQGNPQTVNLTK